MGPVYGFYSGIARRHVCTRAHAILKRTFLRVRMRVIIRSYYHAHAHAQKSTFENCVRARAHVPARYTTIKAVALSQFCVLCVCVCVCFCVRFACVCVCVCLCV